MIIVSAEITISTLADVFGNQLDDFETESFAQQLVTEDITRAARLLKHLEYSIKTAK